MQNNAQNRRQDKSDKYSNQPKRSVSSPSVQSDLRKIIDPHPVNRGRGDRRDFSGNTNGAYKMPNINYNTALKSSRRPNQRDLEDEDDKYYRR